MMTSNIDVLDGLVNGVMGTVVKITEGAKPLGQPQAIAVRFDNERVGRNSRAEYPGSTEVDSGCVLIQAHTEQISYRGQKYTRHQFPLKLCWACTIHKVQGMTLPQIVVSMEGIFKPGMGYVALSRVTSLEGLFLKDLDTKYIYCDKKVKASIESMPEKDLSGTMPIYDMAEDKFVVVFHNVQGLSNKVDDIMANPEMKHANIIAVTETWQNQNNAIQLSGFCAEVQRREVGDRGGVAIYVKDSLAGSYVRVTANAAGLEYVALTFAELNISVCVVYKPHSVSRASLEEGLHRILLALPPGRDVILGGDLNIDLLGDPHRNVVGLPESYVQLIIQPTTSYGSLLDHIYVKAYALANYTSGVCQTYYSDHDPTFVSF